MIVTEVKYIDGERINVQCFTVSQNEYGTRERHYIYCNQEKSKEDAIKHIDEWVKDVNTYAVLLKEKIKELDK